MLSGWCAERVASFAYRKSMCFFAIPLHLSIIFLHCALRSSLLGVFFNYILPNMISCEPNRPSLGALVGDVSRAYPFVSHCNLQALLQRAAFQDDLHGKIKINVIDYSLIISLLNAISPFDVPRAYPDVSGEWPSARSHSLPHRSFRSCKEKKGEGEARERAVEIKKPTRNLEEGALRRNAPSWVALAHWCNALFCFGALLHFIPLVVVERSS